MALSYFIFFSLVMFSAGVKVGVCCKFVFTLFYNRFIRLLRSALCQILPLRFLRENVRSLKSDRAELRKKDFPH